jgi:hypothetical protein
MAQLSPDKLALLARWRTRGGVAIDAPAIRRAPNASVYPTTIRQDLFAGLYERATEPALWNTYFCGDVRGPVEVDRLAASIAAVSARHDVLRASIEKASDGAFVQRVHAGLDHAVRLEVIQARRPGKAEALSEARGIVRHAYQLDQAPLARVALIPYETERALLIITGHHVIADGWTLAVTLRDLQSAFDACRDGRVTLPDLSVRYTDIAVWQRAQLAAGAWDDQMTYWRRFVSGEPYAPLRYDHPFSGAATPSTSAWFDITRPDAERARALARDLGVTPYAVLLAVYAMLLSHRTGHGTVVVGTSAANRNPPETHPVAGFLATTVAVRIAVDPRATFSHLTRAAWTASRKALAMQEISIDVVLGQNAGTPPYDSFFIFQGKFDALQLGDAVMEFEPIDANVADTPLSLEIFDGKRYRGRFEAADCFSAATVRSMAEAFAVLLREAVANPTADVRSLALLAAIS